jgi:hypothetical protein
LTNQLTTTHSIPSSTLDSNLTIVQGSIKDLATVKEVLSHNAQIIVSGIGGSGRMQFSLSKPLLMDDPNICGDAVKTVLTALRELDSEGKLTTRPLFTVISTTGLSKKRDVPLLLYPLYHWLLHVPHIDKRIMEDTVAKATTESNQRIGGFVIVRPTLLTDGAANGKSKVKVGWERHPDAVSAQEAGPGPAMGYTISRADVGAWIFENIVAGNGEWTNRCVTLA